MPMPSLEQCLALIHARQSIAVLSEPAPSQTEIEQAVAAALTAPDHRRLKPWRFVQIDASRRQAFAECMVASLRADGETDEQQLARIAQQPFRAPLILLCIMQYQAHVNVPHFEQVLSCGAVLQNLLLTLHAQGYASIWRTGAIVESPSFKQAFGCGQQDLIAGIIYIGTEAKAAPPREPSVVADFLSQW